MVAGADVSEHRLVKGSGKAGFSENGRLEAIWGGTEQSESPQLEFFLSGTSAREGMQEARCQEQAGSRQKKQD